jgi:hypothetical protein
MKLLISALCILLATPALASKCYHHETDPDWTVIENDPGVSPEFVVRQNGTEMEYDSMSVGTGIDRRILVGDNENHPLPYRYIGDNLLIDNELFYLGCPSNRVWIDSTCSRVLIARDERQDSSYFLIDAGQPVTTCHVVESSFDGTAVDVECNSRRRDLKLETLENQLLKLDGVELKPYTGPLPCSTTAAPK